MLRYLPKEHMGKSDLGWLQSRFHFSFADYQNPDNMNFGVMRVLNDDIIQPQSGFDTHPHKDMEIISYVVDGYLTHKDSMGNEETLTRGEVQYMSAGDGVYHSEHNHHESQLLRILQIWIYPPKKSLPRLYGSYKFTQKDRHNKILNIVSSLQGQAKVKIHQDINIFVNEMDASTAFDFDIDDGKQIYFVCIEGEVNVNAQVMHFGDALEVAAEDSLQVEALSKAHILFIAMNEE